ncbi:MAG: hypothetical protein A3K19_02975 [Lentisphaerae bacterium RIFOXYB12_FULL_65_16]|nr:MAG: hypothetical protein A3K19_02975 [Lentisphaerae bacterium RIFOXYB12_FULL_65_16]
MVAGLNPLLAQVVFRCHCGGGGACVWRANPIHPWHKATGISRMDQRAVVPPATDASQSVSGWALSFIGRVLY